MVFLSGMHSIQVCHFFLQGDIEKGLEMKKLVLSGFLASEEIYINQLEALLLVSLTFFYSRTLRRFFYCNVLQCCECCCSVSCCKAVQTTKPLTLVQGGTKNRTTVIDVWCFSVLSICSSKFDRVTLSPSCSLIKYILKTTDQKGHTTRVKVNSK